MPVLQGFFLVAPFGSPLAANGLLGYVGLGPGQEFIPQFVALLALVVTALLAVLQWPLATLLRRVARCKRTGNDASANNTLAANAVEGSGEERGDKP